MVTTTRCKVRIQEVKPLYHYGKEDGEPYGFTVVVGSPPYDPNPESENGRFFAATPGIQMNLGILNPAVLPLFEAGKDMYVDFTPAD